MIGGDAESDRVRWHKGIALRSVILNVLGDLMRLPDCDDARLGTKNRRHKVPATDVTDTGNAECTVCKVFSCCGVRINLDAQCLQVFVDAKNALFLYFLDDRDCESILGVDSDVEVVVVLDHVSLDVAICVHVVVDVRVDNWVLKHRDRTSLHKEWQHGEVLLDLFHLLAQGDQFCAIHFIRKCKEGDR